jgi:hypothetical protein
VALEGKGKEEVVKKTKRPVSEAGNTAKNSSIAKEWAGKPRKWPEEKQSEKVRRSAFTIVKQQRQPGICIFNKYYFSRNDPSPGPGK